MFTRHICFCYRCWEFSTFSPMCFREQSTLQECVEVCWTSLHQPQWINNQERYGSGTLPHVKGRREVICSNKAVLGDGEVQQHTSAGFNHFSSIHKKLKWNINLRGLEKTWQQSLRSNSHFMQCASIFRNKYSWISCCLSISSAEIMLCLSFSKSS